MANKITIRTKIKKGDIVCYKVGDGYFVGILVRMEKFLGKPGFAVFQIAPEDQIIKELKNIGVDDYQRIHLIDLERVKAEIIKPIELVSMYRSLLVDLSFSRIKEYELREELINIDKKDDSSGGMFS